MLASRFLSKRCQAQFIAAFLGLALSIVPMVATVPSVAAKDPDQNEGHHDREDGPHDRNDARPLHRLERETVLNITVNLNTHNQAALGARLAAPPGVNDPLDPDQFAGLFGATQGEVSSVSSFLQVHRLTVTSVASSRTSISARGTASAIEEAFKITLWVYKDLKGGAVFYSIGNHQPTFPQELRGVIRSVSGLDNQRAFVHSTFSNPVLNGHGPADTQSSPIHGYTPTELREAYTINNLSRGGGCGSQACDGTGQILGLIEPGNPDLGLNKLPKHTYYQPNIDVFDNQFGTSASAVESVAVKDAAPHLDVLTGGEIEAELDIEVVHAIAPKARVRVYETTNFTPSDLLDALSAIADERSDRPSSVSFSGAWCEAASFLQPDGGAFGAVLGVHDRLQQLAAEGVTFFAGSGDTGKYCSNQPTLSTTTSVQWPASDPYTTSVGGTSLFLNEDGSYNSEYAWDSGGKPGEYGSSGGGISKLFYSDPASCHGASGPPSPACMTAETPFQAQIYDSKNTKHWRQVPDVSSLADPRPGIAVYVHLLDGSPGWFSGNGTSASSPSWAAFLTVFHQWTATVPRAGMRVGWANRFLYPLALSSYRPYGPVTLITWNPPNPIDSFIARQPSDELAKAYLQVGPGANCGGPGGPLTDTTVPQGASCNLAGPARPGWSFATGLGSYLADTLVKDLAKLSLMPAVGQAGSAVQATGAQFVPGEAVTITDKTAGLVLCANVRAAPDGSVSCHTRIPATAAAGRERILAQGAQSLRTATFAFTVAPVAGTAAWPMFRGNDKHTGLSAASGPQTNAVRWTYAPSDQREFRPSPAIGADGTVYAASSATPPAGSTCGDGRIGKLNAINTDGTIKWEFSTSPACEDMGDGAPAISSDGASIYVSAAGGGGGALYAVSAATGELRWKSSALSLASAPTVGRTGTIYVADGWSKVYAFNPDGTIRWTFARGQGSSGTRSTPAIASDGTIYVGGGDGQLYALNPDGSQKWAFNTDVASGINASHDVPGSPAVGADGTIYVGSCGQSVYAVNPDGSQKWRLGVGFCVESSPAIGPQGTIYVGGDDHNVYAINPDGTQKWKFLTDNAVFSSPAVGADGRVYIAGINGTVYAFNPDGTTAWAFSQPYSIYSSPALGAGGKLCIGSNGTFYAFG